MLNLHEFYLVRGTPHVRVAYYRAGLNGTRWLAVTVAVVDCDVPHKRRDEDADR
jgi:hypothetical protein